MAKTDGDGWCSVSRGVGVQAKEGRSDHIVAWHDSTSGTPCVQLPFLVLCAEGGARGLHASVVRHNQWEQIFLAQNIYYVCTVMCTTMKTVHFLLILLL